MRRLIALLVGMGESLLALRLVARLLAARPDNPMIERLYAITEPLVMPFKLLGLDAGQPRFGAVLELSTLAMLVAVLLAGFALWWLVPPPKTSP